MKKWQIWLVWFFLLDQMISLFNELAKASGMIIEVPTYHQNIGVRLMFSVLSIIAFTVYTMRMGTSSVLEIKIEREQLEPVD